MDNSENITFIIPNRGGKNIKYVIDKLMEFYPYSKFIVITQNDNDPFMRGQLFNIAYKYCETKYMCFIDNDMFFPKYVDFIGTYNSLNCLAIQPFVNIQQVKISKKSYEVLSEAPKNPFGKGGATFVSKENFEKINGYSNLYKGYGCEDTDFNYRCGGLREINIPICHIKHERRNNDWHWDVNKKLSATRHLRNKSKDGFNNTIANINKNHKIKNVHYLSVSNITVDDDFIYKKELALHNTNN